MMLRCAVFLKLSNLALIQLDRVVRCHRRSANHGGQEDAEINMGDPPLGELKIELGRVNRGRWRVGLRDK
ncbi:hypothetical protein RRG08_060347 [Elysia crispata]|uniref:Secreted protein n=1 Tax=Elysia crispata TaxID=231223 RepID=A0AAE0ZGC3_9GAST|nr:hypothetical protein RRG08_060347 [Elysia crispata]